MSSYNGQDRENLPNPHWEGRADGTGRNDNNLEENGSRNGYENRSNDHSSTTPDNRNYDNRNYDNSGIIQNQYNYPDPNGQYGHNGYQMPYPNDQQSQYQQPGSYYNSINSQHPNEPYQSGYYWPNQQSGYGYGYDSNGGYNQQGMNTGYGASHWASQNATQNYYNHYYTPTPNNPYPVIEPVAQPYNRFNMIWELMVTEASAFLPGFTSAIVIGAQRLLGQNSTAIIEPLVNGHLGLDIFLQVLVALFGTYAVFLIGYLLYRSGESFKAIGLTTKYTGTDVGLTILLAVGAFAIAFLLGFVTAALHLQPTTNPATAPNISHYYLIVGFADSLYTSFLEEVAVCGFLLHRLQQMNVKPIYAILISTAVRCSYHVYGGWPLVAMTIPFGLMQAYVYQRTRSIKCQVGAHFIYDSIIFALNIL